MLNGKLELLLHEFRTPSIELFSCCSTMERLFLRMTNSSVLFPIQIQTLCQGIRNIFD